MLCNMRSLDIDLVWLFCWDLHLDLFCHFFLEDPVHGSVGEISRQTNIKSTHEKGANVWISLPSMPESQHRATYSRSKFDLVKRAKCCDF